MLRHKQDAEDVAQEAFVKAYRNFRDLRNRERFRAWLIRMTWRLAIDRRRNDLRREAREDRAAEVQRGRTFQSFTTDRMPAAATSSSAHGSRAVQGVSPAIHDDLEARERAERLWAAIDALPEKLRIAIVLANIEEHDIGEVARLLDVPEGTVKSRLFLARRRLKELLQ